MTSDAGPIVIGFDDSSQARAAADWAAAEAEHRGCDLHLLHAVDTGVSASLRDVPPDATERIVQIVRAEHGVLDAEAARLRTAHPELKLTTDLPRGAPTKAVLDAAQAVGAALIVVGTRGRGGFAGLVLGSVSLRVTAHASCPMVVVRGRSEWHRGRSVVVGVRDRRDFAAVRFALDAADRRGAPVRALHAWAPWADVALMAPQVGNLREGEHGELMSGVRELAAGHPRVTLDTELVSGRSAASLVDASAEAELLVVAVHRSGNRFSLGLGPAVHAVLHHAECPVVVVPAG